MNVEPPQKGLKTFVLLVAIGMSAFVISRAVSLSVQSISRAEATEQPENVKVTNITAESATISWLTNIDTLAYVLYGPTTALGSSETTINKGTTHHIDLNDLSPNTTYYFKVGVGRKSYDNEGEFYRFTTAPRIGSGISYKVYGQILDLSGALAENAIVYLVIKDKDNRGSNGISAPLSYLTSSNGIFSMDLSEAKTSDLTSPFYFSKSGDLVEIAIRGQNGEKASVLLDTNQLQPTPTIRLSIKGRLQDLTGQGASKGEDIILPKPQKNNIGKTNPIEKLWQRLLRR